MQQGQGNPSPSKNNQQKLESEKSRQQRRMQALPDPRGEILRGKKKLVRTCMSAQEGVQVCAIGNHRQPEETSETHRSGRERMVDKHSQAALQHFALLISGNELVGAIGTDIMGE